MREDWDKGRGAGVQAGRAGHHWHCWNAGWEMVFPKGGGEQGALGRVRSCWPGQSVKCRHPEIRRAEIRAAEGAAGFSADKCRPEPRVYLFISAPGVPGEDMEYLKPARAGSGKIKTKYSPGRDLDLVGLR